MRDFSEKVAKPPSVKGTVRELETTADILVEGYRALASLSADAESPQAKARVLAVLAALEAHRGE